MRGFGTDKGGGVQSPKNLADVIYEQHLVWNHFSAELERTQLFNNIGEPRFCKQTVSANIIIQDRTFFALP